VTRCCQKQAGGPQIRQGYHTVWPAECHCSLPLVRSCLACCLAILIFYSAYPMWTEKRRSRRMLPILTDQYLAVPAYHIDWSLLFLYLRSGGYSGQHYMPPPECLLTLRSFFTTCALAGCWIASRDSDHSTVSFTAESHDHLRGKR